MSTTPSNGQNEILKFAREYQHNPNQHVVLEPHKEAILLLRAKYATYDTNTETLKQKGVDPQVLPRSLQ
jgi:intracellular sulfur oxidation DsrE/DsrF family protein